MKPIKPITVVIAEDHAIVREGLSLLLEMSGDFEIVGKAKNGREAVELVRNLRPEVVVMDIAMPLLNGFEATRQILQHAPETKVLVLSAHSDDEYVAHMAFVGASGYLEKENSGQVLVHAIKEISKGHSYFSPSIAKRLAIPLGKHNASGESAAWLENSLTPREAEVLQLVAEGSANKQVGAELGISIKTVEKHRQQLMDKLNIHDTAGLTRYAIATGVVESSIQVSIA